MKRSFLTAVTVVFCGLAPLQATAQCTQGRCGPPFRWNLVLFLVPADVGDRPEVVAAFTSREIADAPHIQMNVMTYRTPEELARLQIDNAGRPDLGALGIVAEPDQVDSILAGLRSVSRTHRFPLAIIAKAAGRPTENVSHVQMTETTRIITGPANSTTALLANQYLMNWWIDRK